MTDAAANENPVIQKAVETVQSIEKKINEFFRAVNDVLSWVPEAFTYLIEPIKKGVAEINEKLNEFWSKINHLLERAGDPEGLRQVGDQWANSVGNPMSDVAADIGLEKLRSNTEWEGKAAEAYKAVVPAQSEGLSSIKDLSTQMSNSLHSLADAIESFWMAILFAICGFIVGITLAAMSAIGVVTTPAGIAAFLTALAACVTLIGTAVQQFNTYLDTIETTQRTIRQKIQDLGNQWSKSSTSMSDGSVSDGDPSDWRINS